MTATLRRNRFFTDKGSSGALEDRRMLVDQWESYNVEPVEYNPDYPGSGRNHDGDHNRVQISEDEFGRTSLNRDSKLYDAQGNHITDVNGDLATAEAGLIGKYDGEYYGAVNALGLTQIDIGDGPIDMVYLHSAPLVGGGSFSGYTPLINISNRDELKTAMVEIDERYEDVVSANEDRTYLEYEFNDFSIPGETDDSIFYVLPDKDVTSTGNRARQYHYRYDTNKLYINVAGTGGVNSGQQYGVAVDKQPLGAKFYRDDDVEVASVPVYANNSDDPDDTYSFDMLYGYTETNTGDRRYGWVNEANVDRT